MDTNSTIAQDIVTIQRQEEALCFERFDPSTAWALGIRIKESCEARQCSVTIEIRLSGNTQFFYAMPGTAPSHADWARRKRNTVELLHRSSYGVGLSLAAEGNSLDKKMGLPLRDYATHGGSFPIRVVGVGCIGAVTVSGLPQRDDHALVVEVMAEMCGLSAEDYRLPS